MSETRLVLAGIGKTYPGGVQAVADVSLELGPRELLVLVGPSGCGKTTLLRLAAGLEEPDTGRITLAGRDLTGVPPAQRDVALVFQSHALYPAKTVFENLAFSLRLRRTPRAEIDQRVRAIAGRLGLEAVLNIRPGQLSGGQQQRVALGRALVRRPALFLLDEPLSDLDAGLRRDLRRLIKQVQRELAVPTIHVTHDQEEAMALADRLVVMNAGRVLQSGAPRELYQRPVCRFVAGFIGSPPMNFLEGQLVSREGRLRFSWANEEQSLPTGWLQPYSGEPIVLGVRPEALSVAPSCSESLMFTGSVELVEFVGERMDVTMQLGQTRMTARLDVRQAPGEGDRLTLFASPSACQWFRPGPEGERLARSE